MIKYKSILGIALLLLLIFSGCPELMTSGGKTQDAPPAGMGYFLLLIDGVQSSRTIMPAMPNKESLFYKLEFFKHGASEVFKTFGPVAYSNISPVLLDEGAWDLTVSAYKDSAGTQKTAQSKKIEITITSGATTAKNVTLEFFTATGDGQGSFKWNISYPDDVSMARMTIAKTIDGDDDIYYFKSDTPVDTTLTSPNSSISLDTGYYFVTFNLTMGGKKLERKEILHIYKNLESSCTYVFTELNFFAKMTGIEIDESNSQTEYALGEPLKLFIYAVYDDTTKSITLDEVTNNYDATKADTQNITITHASTNFTASISVNVLGNAARIGTTNYATLNGAINAAENGTEGSPTEIFILRDITAPEWEMQANTGYKIPTNKHIRLTVTAPNNYTITASAGDFNLFSVTNPSSSLTLNPDTGGGTLKLSGANKPAQTDRQGAYISISTGIFTMNDGVIITGFNSINGGGVYNLNGTFNMNGGKISGNTATSNGGGVYLGSGTFNMNGGTIGGDLASKNTATNGGGVYVAGGTFNLNSGTIGGDGTDCNTAITNGGGGVYWNSSGTFNMNGGTIGGDLTSKNTATNGGGVYVASGTFNLNSGTIGGDGTDCNTATTNGGGVYVSSTGAFTLGNGSIIKGNTANGTISTNGGGGVYWNSSGTFTMNSGGKISGNKANNGGGVYLGNGTFTMSGGTIGGTDAASKNIATGTNANCGNGGGVYLTGTSAKFDMSNGNIQGNSATGTVNNSGNGGGVYVNNGTFTMSGGQIGKATAGAANSTTGSGTTNSGYGGGVYVGGGTFKLNSGTIGGTGEGCNTAKSGGGVYVASNGTFTLGGEGIIKGNTANGTEAANGGGGVYFTTGTTFTMDGGTIGENGSPNKAIYEGSSSAIATCGGGGVYFYGSSFTMNNGTINYNIATGSGENGGGVYVNTGTFNMNGGTIQSNNGYSGGGVYVINGTLNMSDSGEIKGNTANVNGGGVTVVTQGTGDSKGKFNMSGGSIIENNAPSGGGVFFSSASNNFNMSNGKIASNHAANNGGGICLNAGIFIMSGGYVYGGDGDSYNPIGIPNTATSGAAIFVGTGGTAKYDAPLPLGVFTTTSNTLPDTSSFEAKIGTMNYTTLALAFSYATDGQTITVIKDIINQAPITITGKTITLTNDDNRREISVSSGSLFTVESGAKLILQGNSLTNTLTLVGKNNNTASLINVAGYFVLNNYAIINGNTSGGVLVAESGTFEMTGGEITSNEASSGGGVFNNGTFTMSGGKISENTATNTGGNSGGGGVYNGGTFTMTDGEISGNNSNGNGGGVYNSGTFKMSGGTIYGNEPASSSFINKATGDGAAIFVNTNASAQYDMPYGPGAITTTNDTLPQ